MSKKMSLLHWTLDLWNWDHYTVSNTSGTNNSLTQCQTNRDFKYITVKAKEFVTEYSNMLCISLWPYGHQESKYVTVEKQIMKNLQQFSAVLQRSNYHVVLPCLVACLSITQPCSWGIDLITVKKTSIWCAFWKCLFEFCCFNMI